jgi:hypothetical protein
LRRREKAGPAQPPSNSASPPDSTAPKGQVLRDSNPTRLVPRKAGHV